MKIGYNTSGFAYHRLEDAISIIADTGYQAVGLTLDVHHLDPYTSSQENVLSVARQLQRLGLACVIETGARFVIDPLAKHKPTLVDEEPSHRRRREEFLTRCLDIACDLGAKAVSLWSGTSSRVIPITEAIDRMRPSLERLLIHAEKIGIQLAFEPEPGMCIETIDDGLQLMQAIPHRSLGLTLDLGHLGVTEHPPFEESIRRCRNHLLNVHIDDVRLGVHEHLVPGEGDLPLGKMQEVLKDVEFQGIAAMELGRDAHNAVAIARESLRRWKALSSA